jgi:hypothetical protein
MGQQMSPLLRATSSMLTGPHIKWLRITHCPDLVFPLVTSWAPVLIQAPYALHSLSPGISQKLTHEI